MTHPNPQNPAAALAGNIAVLTALTLLLAAAPTVALLAALQPGKGGR